MAKGARASTRKRNNAALRAKVFGPAHDARTERLSAKLQEIAAKPRPETEKEMEVEQEPEEKQEPDNEEMELDGATTKRKSKRSMSLKEKRSSRVEKKLAGRKPRNTILFRGLVARKRRQDALKKRVNS